MNNLYVYLPCYNEEKNIALLIDEWIIERERLLNEGYYLKVKAIDDASTDGTLEVIRRKCSSDAGISCISHSENKNLGGVLMTAISDFLAHAQGNDLMCFMDGDNTHKPEFACDLINTLKGETACAIASRYQPGAKIFGLSKRREVFSVFARIYYTAILHVPGVRDYTCGYRIYTRAALQAGVDKYGERFVERNTFACMMEVLYKLYRCGCVFSEVPFILYYNDKEGKSKMNVWKTTRDSLVTALQLRMGE